MGVFFVIHQIHTVADIPHQQARGSTQTEQQGRVVAGQQEPDQRQKHYQVQCARHGNVSAPAGARGNLLWPGADGWY